MFVSVSMPLLCFLLLLHSRSFLCSTLVISISIKCMVVKPAFLFFRFVNDSTTEKLGKHNEWMNEKIYIARLKAYKCMLNLPRLKLIAAFCTLSRTFRHWWSIKGDVWGCAHKKNLCNSTNSAMRYWAYFEDISTELFAFFSQSRR